MEWLESIKDLLLSYGITDNLITAVISIIGYLIIYFRTGTKYLTKKLNLNQLSSSVIANSTANLDDYNVYYKGNLIKLTDLTFKKKEVK